MSQLRSNVCCIIMGGGRGSRLYPLTKVRCKPAVPLGGKYRIVDIPISNCLNSGYNQIYLLTQFNTESLHKHVHETYRFDYFGGGFVEILSAEQTDSDENWYQGTADAVRQNLKHIPFKDDTTVLILSGDQLYRMDTKAFIQQHLKNNADITIASKAFTGDQIKQFGIMKVDSDLSIQSFAEKPKDEEVIKNFYVDDNLRKKIKDKTSAKYCLASMGIYAFKGRVLKECLDSNDHDFGKHIIPNALQKYRLYGYIFDNYWEDIGTVNSFFEANMMLTDVIPAFDFYNEIDPIYSKPRSLAASKLNSCKVDRSIVADGCIISDANVNRCVIGVRSIIREGSQLENVYMMGADHYERIDEIAKNKSVGIPNIGIGENCYIRNAIIDRNVRIGNGVRLSPEGKADGFKDGEIFVKDGLLCISKNGIIPDGTII